ncbi:hypothetical protein MYAER_2364 [Microcystis aeruginosa NIES-2549]|uniref:Uncharacterized protein n=1 Tax=Microcystis aeruginosa NIES-2549 TaxID=1641812 RepID=A0A0F6RLW1_MICAE|nr:hypothetical protein MYAER_2364 [Microcystis aeruginosa NIES-2549]AOC53107.1 hypothetical protein amyaer_2394 [Microcystis aeruginosa NIES-2481]
MTKMANRVSLSIKYRDGSENLADGFRLPLSLLIIFFLGLLGEK